MQEASRRPPQYQKPRRGRARIRATKAIRRWPEDAPRVRAANRDQCDFFRGAVNFRPGIFALDRRSSRRQPLKISEPVFPPLSERTLKNRADPLLQADRVPLLWRQWRRDAAPIRTSTLFPPLRSHITAPCRNASFRGHRRLPEDAAEAEA